MRRIVPLAVTLLAALLATSVAPAGEVYKWVDENGNVHYSDTPVVEEARPADLPEPMTFDAPEVTAPPRAASDEGTEDQGPVYTEFGFISPKENQVFWATGGEIPVQLALSPGLRPGHAVNLYLNGELTDGSPMGGLGTTLTGVYRGAYNIRAVVVSEDGQELAATEPVTFHVKQRSIANPQRARN